MVGAALVLAAAGCGSTTSGGSPSASSGSPSAGSLDSTLRPIVESEMQKMQIPGVSVYVSSPTKGEWKAALGVADVSNGTPSQVADHFRIGSITKTMTATVILQLVQEGKVSLDAPLTTYLPGTKSNGATVRQALQMTSGIGTYTTIPFLNGLADQPQKVWTPEELVQLGTSAAPSFAAGAEYEYSNTNYILLGQIAEKVTGQPFAQLLQQRVFDPLGMTGCSQPAATDASMPAPYSHGYMFGTDWDRKPSPPAPLPAKVDVSTWNPSWGWSAGGVICDLDSLKVWPAALATGKLLSPEIQKQRLEWRTIVKQPLLQYGLGIGNWDGLVGHNGEISGYTSKAVYRVSDGTTIVVLTNLTSAPDDQGPAEVLTDAIVKALPPSS